MRKTFKLSLLILSCMTSVPCLALHPVPGWYGGVFLGVTYSPNINFNLNPSKISQSSINSFEYSLSQYLNIPLAEIQSILGNVTLPNTNVPGTIKYSTLGGLGLDIGYRIESDYRIESEILYNNNPFADFTLAGHSIGSSTYTAFDFNGATSIIALLFNFIYDIPVPSKDGYSNLRPYIGLGAGFTHIFSSIRFKYGENFAEQQQGAEPTTLYATTLYNQVNTIGAQGIFGMSYSIDDFCWFSIDARYFTTPSQLKLTTTNYGVNFQSKLQLFSVMFGFHGVLNRG